MTFSFGSDIGKLLGLDKVHKGVYGRVLKGVEGIRVLEIIFEPRVFPL